MKTALLSTLAITMALASARGATWTGGGTDDNWSTPANWGGIIPSPGETLIFTTTSRLNNTNNFSPGTTFNGITFQPPAGNFVLNGNLITLGGDIVDNQFVTLQTINLSLVLGTTRNVDVTADGALIIAGVVSGGGGITKTGAGLLTLGAANAFGGSLTVNAGTVGLSSDSNLGGVPLSPTPNKIVLNDGALRATSSFAINANRGIAVSGHGTFDIGAGITLTYGGTAAGAGGLSKLKFGGLTLSGANTYTGPTAISNGTVTLDFSQPSSPVNNIINSSSSLSMGGATAGRGTVNNSTLMVNPKANTVNAQAFNDTRIYFGPAVIQVNGTNDSTANLSLGAITHFDGGVVAFVPPTLRGGQGRITTTSQNHNGILGGWATISDGTVATGWTRATNWASVDPTGSIVNYTGHTVYESGLVKDILFGTNNLVIPNSISTDLDLDVDDAGSVTDVNTIIFDRNAAWTFRIGNNNTLRLGKSGALFNRLTVAGPTWVVGSGTAGANGSQATAGRLTAGGPDSDSPGELILINTTTGSGSGNNWNIDAQIVDNGLGPVTLVKSGSGYCKLRNHNTYSGGTYFLGGRIQLAGNETGSANPGGIGTGPLYIFPGSYLYVNFGASVLTNEAFIAGTGTPQETGLGGMRLGNNVVYSGPITLIGDARLCGQNNNNGGTFSGRISGPFSLTLGNRSSINGNVTLSNPENSWTGNTILEARDNTGNNNFINGASDVVPNGFGFGNVIMDSLTTGSITWNLNGFNETINGLTTSANGPTSLILNNGANPSTLTVGDNDQSGTFAGSINDGAGVMNLTKIGGGILTLSAGNGYTGVTTVEDGTLALGPSGSISNSQQIIINGGRLDVTDVAGGFAHAFPISVDNGTLALRNTVAPGLAALSLTNSRVRITSVGGTPVTIDTVFFTTGGDSNVIDIASVGNVSGYPAQFTLIKYAGFIDGAGFNFVLGNVPTASTVGYISNNVGNSSVDLVLLDGPKALFWTGAANNNWDINTSVNWRAFGVTPSVYLDIDLVRFDGSSSVNTVNLTTTVLPSAVTVSNETATYTFTGPGKISGPTGLTKDGAGTLILNNSGANDFFGPFTINAGAVQVGNNSANGSLGADGVINNANLAFARSDNPTIPNPISGPGTITQNGPGVVTLSGNSTFTGPAVVAQSTLKVGSANALGTAEGPTIVSSGATLDVNGQNLSAEPIVVGGAGVGGNGALVNTGGDQLNAFRIVTLNEDTVFGGTSRWDIRTNAAGAGELRTEGRVHNITKVGTNQVSLVGVNVDPFLTDIDVREGTFSVQTTTSQLGELGGLLTVQRGATLGLFGLNANPLNKAITLHDGATLWNENGISVVSGQIILEGTVTVNAANAGTTPSLNVTGEFGGTGGITKIGSGQLIMAGPFNAYTGPTVVSNGTLLVDGNYSDITTGRFTVQGGTLGGTGAISAPVTINLAGALAPGSPANTIGTLTFANTLTLGGATRMDVNKTGGAFASDFVSGVTALQFGGTLQLNLTGEPLAIGDTFNLFNFTSATGNFMSIDPATPGAGLAWDTSQLAVSGALGVVAFTARPEFATVQRSGTNVVMSGSNGTPGATFYVLSSTNIATPLPEWTSVQTNVFDASGNFSVTNLIDPATPQRFFLLQTPN